MSDALPISPSVPDAPSPIPSASNLPDPHAHIIRFRWTRRLALGLTLVLVAFAVAYLVWDLAARRALAASIADLHARNEPLAFADFQLPSIPPAENAALLYQDATAKFSLTAVETEWLPMVRQYPLPPSYVRPLTELAEHNTATLATLRAASAHPRADWNIDFTHMTYGAAAPASPRYRYTDIHRLCQLCRLHAYLSLARGNQAEALAAARDALLLSDRAALLLTDRADHSFMLGQMIASSSGTVATDTLHEIAPFLNIGPAPDAPNTVPAAAIRQLIAELLDESAPHNSLVRAYQAERVYARLVIENELPWYAATPLGRLDIVRVFHVIDQFTDAARQSDFPDAERIAPSESTLFGNTTLLSSLSRRGSLMTLPPLSRPFEFHYRLLADRRMAALALALRLYAADHNGTPAPTLEALVPNYLPAVPLDPFAAAGPIHYLTDPANPRLYSVGANGIDEGGIPTLMDIRFGTPRIAPRLRQSDQIFYLKPGTRPDAPARFRTWGPATTGPTDPATAPTPTPWLPRSDFPPSP